MTTLVLLPGLDGTGTLFNPLVDALQGAVPTKVIAYPPDLAFGYETLELIAERLLPQHGPIVLLGESFSGPIAIALAAKHPDRINGLILCCTFVSRPRPLLAPLSFLAKIAPIKELPVCVSSIPLLGRYSTPDLKARLKAALASVSGAVLRTRLQAAMSVDALEELRRVKVPVLYLQAMNDWVVPRRVASTIKQIQPHTVVVEVRGPHCLLQAAPTETAQLIREFMRKAR